MPALRRSLVFATGALEGLPALAREAEAAGFHRVFTTEYRDRDAIARALVIALGTERIGVATGIAYAFTRAPLALAALAADVQRLSGGRFGLGLGSGTRGVRRWYGAEGFDKPAPALEAYVGSLRESWGDAGFADLDPPPPIYGAALNSIMVKRMARSCDGVLLHPLARVRRHLTERVAPALAAGGAERTTGGAPEVCAWCIASIDADEDRARERGRAQLAFYLSTPSYASVLEGTEWEEVPARVREGFDAGGRSGDWAALAPLIPEGLVDELVVAGPPEAARARVAEIETELAAHGVTELVFQTVGAGLSDAEAERNCAEIVQSLTQAEVQRQP